MTKAKSESQNYQDMLNEVENIIQDISSSEVDLDHMITKVERGFVLIKQMRDRLQDTKEKIEKLREEYEKE